MTPKEKAKEMYDKMLNSDIMNMTKYCAKQCALMAVEEILNNYCGSHTDGSNATNSEIYCDEYFWIHVKSELQSL
jgi:chemotaxis protein CheY-P-specific phosphatase CheC